MCTMTRNIVRVLAVAVVSSLLFFSSCQRPAPAPRPALEATEPQLVDDANDRDDTYKILERKYLNDTLAFSVTKRNLDDAKEIAEELIEPNKHEQMVRVFFYDTDLTDSIDQPQLLYEWTKSQGLVLRYDLRLPPPKKPQRQGYPEYKVLSENRLIEKRVFWEVLIPGLSPRTKPKEIERICRIICYEEGIDDCSFYSTMEAYEANNSDSYSREHPEALKQGYLGMMQKGEFFPPSN
jgi:hypothetical protein